MMGVKSEDRDGEWSRQRLIPHMHILVNSELFYFSAALLIAVISVISKTGPQ